MQQNGEMTNSETTRTNLGRREFLGQAGAVLGWAMAGSLVGPRAVQAAESSGALITGKDGTLIVYNPFPPEIETPLELLRAHRVTPTDILFVRNNQALDGALTLKPLSLDDWKVELGGRIAPANVISGAELSRLPQVETELVLQCSGNGRAFFAKSAKAEGAQWQRGAMGNVRFKGVPLKAVLDKLGIKVDPSARFLTAEGRDVPAKAGAADFEHSIPLATALEKSFLALELNGQPIPAVHGGPVRLITPGYYGTMNVKWLSRLRFETHETTNHHQVGRYRTPLKPIPPGSKFEYNLENSEPNWGMKIKSVIFSPLDRERLAAGNVEVRGVAWNDGTAKIVSVDVSIDGGAHWQQAKLESPASPYAWYQWSTVLALKSGPQHILSRAVDALGRSQPLDGSIGWNPAGYAWNGVDTVSVDVVSAE